MKHMLGRVCIKIAGRDAKGIAVIVKQLDEGNVLVDGTVRRRKCNLRHLEPTGQTLDIKEDAGHDEVIKGLQKLGYAIEESGKKKPAKAKTERPKKQKAKKQPKEQKADKSKGKKAAKAVEKPAKAVEKPAAKTETPAEKPKESAPKAKEAPAPKAEKAPAEKPVDAEKQSK